MRVTEQRVNAIAVERRRVGVVEELKVRPVEARQAASRAHPEIAVCSLNERLDGLFGEAFLYAENRGEVR